jgi:glycosyltransferase involved in cell wall biosynthesis
MHDSTPKPFTELSPELSIVIPCLNEAATLPRCLAKARAFLDAHKVKGEIIVADNGSTDGSLKIAAEAEARVVMVPEKGYGAALAGGNAAARGRFIIMGDADDSYDFSDLMPLLEKLREGFDLVVGNRFKGGIKSGAMPFLNRYLGNPVLSFMGRLFFHIPLGDFHCGLRGLSKSAFEKLELRTTGMEYASEMIVQASLSGLRMAEVPVTLWPDGRGRAPHLKPWRDGWRHLRFLLLYSPRWLYLYPGLAMIFFGVLVSGLLLPGPMVIADGVGLDVHTLLVAAMSILIGTQSITFGFMARTYAMRNGIIPKETRYAKYLLGITLEKLLVLSVFLIFIGFCAMGLALHRWSAVDFGALDYRNAMRILIFALTTIVAGFQLGFAAFLTGVMQIKHK